MTRHTVITRYGLSRYTNYRAIRAIAPSNYYDILAIALSIALAIAWLSLLVIVLATGRAMASHLLSHQNQGKGEQF